MTDSHAEQGDMPTGGSDRAFADSSDPKKCPICGSDDTQKSDHYIHTNPPEATVYMNCQNCSARFCYSFRTKPSLETVRVRDRPQATGSEQ